MEPRMKRGEATAAREPAVAVRSREEQLAERRHVRRLRRTLEAEISGATSATSDVVLVVEADESTTEKQHDAIQSPTATSQLTSIREPDEETTSTVQRSRLVNVVAHVRANRV